MVINLQEYLRFVGYELTSKLWLRLVGGFRACNVGFTSEGNNGYIAGRRTDA
jgi:hypothetical protein